MQRTLIRWAGIVLFAALSTVWSLAQTNCEEGNGKLDPAQPQNMSVQDIIQKFAAKESVFKQARNAYTYTQDITVQTVDGNTVDGEYRQIWDITYDDKGGRVEQVKYAPQETLTRISMTREDFDDFRNRLPFVLTTEDLPIYDIIYVGRQHLDEIDTYVFDMAPKRIEKGKRYFQGRLWVDNQDFQIVKTCGRNVPPTYSRADDTLHFQGGDVHVREIIKYTNYKRFGSKTRIIFKGEVPPDQQEPKNQKPPETKPPQ